MRTVDREVVLPTGEKHIGQLSGLRINRFHLTGDFFWLKEHLSRIKSNITKQERRYGWTVKSVSPTDRVEEVFCAVVDEVGAFGLADGIMTGNCFLKGAGLLLELIRKRPESAEWWAEREREREMSARQQVLRKRKYALFDASRPSYAELLAISQGKQDGPGWLWSDSQDGSCGEIECRCTD